MDLNNTLHTKENTVLYRLKLFIKNNLFKHCSYLTNISSAPRDFF